MRRADQQQDRPPDETAPPLSLKRIRSAMASLLGPSPGSSRHSQPGPLAGAAPVGDRVLAETDDGSVTLRGVIEARLFVGGDRAGPMPPESLVEGVDGATTDDAAATIEELRGAYADSNAPLELSTTPAGCRLRVAPQWERLGQRLGRRTRARRLSDAALETLAIVAYQQPVGAAQIDQLRSQRSAAAVHQLIRFGLIERRPAGDAAETDLVTTERFLRVLGLATLDQLPKPAELDD